MNIVVILGSHRLGGTNGEIEEMLKELDTNHTFDFIHLAEKRVEGCILQYKNVAKTNIKV